jgi:hypothetical protein
MRFHLAVLSVGLILVASGLVGHAEVLTFDDVTDAHGDTTIPDGYGGFNWDEFGVVYGTGLPGSGYDNGRVSGDYVAFNRKANVATIDDGLFDFNSAYLTAAWNTGLNIRVQGFVGGNLFPNYDRTVVVNTTGPTLFNFDYLGINKLVFDSYGGFNADYDEDVEHFVMDDFTFNKDARLPFEVFLGDTSPRPSVLDLPRSGLGSSAGPQLGMPLSGSMNMGLGMGLGAMPIPEPSSFALTTISLLGLLVYGWRRQTV